MGHVQPCSCQEDEGERGRDYQEGEAERDVAAGFGV